MKTSEKRRKRLDKLATLEDKWRRCQKCDLAKERVNTVFWRGDPCAKLFIIGEAPGVEEGERALPLVGSAGVELDSMLTEIGVDVVKDVFITDAVCCQTPEGRTMPTRLEVQTCRPRLDRMLAIVRPKIVLLLGATALGVANRASIVRWRHKTFDLVVASKKGEKTMDATTTYHPSFLLRRRGNPLVRAEIIKDITAAWKLTKEQ